MVQGIHRVTIQDTLEMELSTTNRGDRPSASTIPNLPAATFEYDAVSASMPPGTCAIEPRSNFFRDQFPD